MQTREILAFARSSAYSFRQPRHGLHNEWHEVATGCIIISRPAAAARETEDRGKQSPGQARLEGCEVFAAINPYRTRRPPQGTAGHNDSERCVGKHTQTHAMVHRNDATKPTSLVKDGQVEICTWLADAPDTSVMFSQSNMLNWLSVGMSANVTSSAIPPHCDKQSAFRQRHRCPMIPIPCPVMA